MESLRPDGYYWIKAKWDGRGAIDPSPEWEVALFVGGGWSICGSEMGNDAVEVGPRIDPPRLYVVEWNPVDDTYLVGIFTSEAKARAVFDSFQSPMSHDGLPQVGWVFLNEYELDRVNPLEAPKQLAERRIE